MYIPFKIGIKDRYRYKRLVEWLEKAPAGMRSEMIKEALNEYLKIQEQSSDGMNTSIESLDGNGLIEEVKKVSDNKNGVTLKENALDGNSEEGISGTIDAILGEW